MPPLFDFTTQILPRLNYQSLFNKEAIDYVAACQHNKGAIFVGQNIARNFLLIKNNYDSLTFDLPFNSVVAVASLGNRIIVGNQLGQTAYSDNDGETWTNGGFLPASPQFASDGSGVIFATCSGLTFVSTDGANWTNVSADFPTTTRPGYPGDVKYFNGLFYIASNVPGGSCIYTARGTTRVGARYVNLPNPFNLLTSILFNNKLYGITSDQNDNSNIYQFLDENNPSTRVQVPSFLNNRKSSGLNIALNYEIVNNRLIIATYLGLLYLDNGVFKQITLDASTPQINIGSFSPFTQIDGKAIFFGRSTSKFYTELNT
jgi:hypothetical protein